MFHTVVGANTDEQMENVYKLGNTSYFSESAFNLNRDYANWYWGENAPRL